ncbi:hypothetical protein LWI28_027670 [Acer negundo]|uniref:Uncharacterized protein n=1 Tax=Acer negundo TaxID=4023 RepID=A0AAD5J6K8_ACENE|nr:hypothetical protein LWI28_027670 [Acer negundo]
MRIQSHQRGGRVGSTVRFSSRLRKWDLQSEHGLRHNYQNKTRQYMNRRKRLCSHRPPSKLPLSKNQKRSSIDNCKHVAVPLDLR